MMQDRKYFGMTVQQLGILGGLAAFACLLFGMTGIVMLRRNPAFLSNSPASTATVQPTSMIVLSPTRTSTATPTPIPYDQLIPKDWKQFKTALIEIWLPPAFKSINKDADEELAASSTNSKTSLYKMRVSVSYQPLVGDSVDATLDDRISKMDTTIRVVERRKVSLNSIDAIRLTLEGRIENVDINELVYVIQDGTTAWFVVYVAQINEFYEMLPSFEQSILTFRIVR
jgi:hypothetical protein